MKRLAVIILGGWLLSGSTLTRAMAEERITFEDEESFLFMEIPVVVTASHQPQEVSKAPATTYVLTAEDIKASGALSVADALRQVPGVDVMAVRTGDPQISIRGLNHSMANNTLVLLDGKTVLMGYFDTMIWETLPVTLDEIDRIEVVAGPASALYGANAVNGVINIITKTPEQLKGGKVRLTGGERKTRMGSVVYGKRTGRWDYKFGAGWNSINQFEDASLLSSNANKFHALAGYQMGDKTNMSVSGGFSNINTQTNISGIGIPYLDGPAGFLRTDFVHNDTKVRAFWNHSTLYLRDFAMFENPDMNSDDYNVNIAQSLRLFPANDLVLGGEYIKKTMHSSLLASRSQDLWATFIEDNWDFQDHWTLVISGRMDHHPLTGISFSPRGSLICSPAAAHTFRVSGGTSFKDPSLIENYLELNVPVPNAGGSAIPNPPYTQIESRYNGNKDLRPARLAAMEVAHNGDFGRVRTTVVGFHYRLKNMIDTTPVVPVSMAPPPPVYSLQSTYFNHGEASAWGGEFGANILLSRVVTVFANYSYQSIRFKVPSEPAGRISQPKHKVNGGVRFKRNGFTSSAWVDWVDKTFWNASAAGVSPRIAKLEDYALLNAYAGYAFWGNLRDLEIGLSAFNVGDHRHYEILPSQGPTEPGQLGEIVRSRIAVTLSYRF